ncbi:hypothetical protein ACWEQL_27385, partial [Kitasatospora sp. NPDC004240]
MTQDGQFSTESGPFAAAERISATLGALTEALFGKEASRYPAAALTALRPGTHPAAGTLFNLPLAPNGPVHTAVDRLGTVLTAGTARPGSGVPVAPAAVDALLARYGGGPVRGAVADRGTLAAALFELPVAGEIADPKLRPPFAPALAALADGRQTREPVELATGSGAEVRLVVPPGFHPLTSPGGPPGVSARTVPTGPAAPATGPAAALDPVARAAAAELGTHLGEVAEELFSGTGPERRRDFAVIAATLADLISSGGVVYAGVGALELDGRATDATLVISLAHHPRPITELSTELATLRRHAEVWTVLLPAGPAAVLVEGRSVPVPAPLAADGQRRWLVTSVVEAFVPLPDGVTVLCVQLATAHPQEWELYTEVFAELLGSVQFGWDGVPGRPGAHLAAGAPAVPVAPVPVAPVPPAVTPPAAPVAVPAASAVPADAGAGPDPARRPGTAVRVPPADFNPFAPVADDSPLPELPPLPDLLPASDFVPPTAPPAAAQAAPALASADSAFAGPAAGPIAAEPAFAAQPPTEQPPAGQAAAVPAPVEQAAGAEDETLKGTPVQVPPPDFNPFAPQPTLTDTTVPEQDGDEDETLKGTPVRVPPPDFNPFAPQPTEEAAPAGAPAAAPAVTLTEVPVSDPFGTRVASEEPTDPFGTTIPKQQPSPVPPPPPAPPAAPPAVPAPP